MPNLCMNELKLTHKDPAMIERAMVAFKNRSLLNEFIPCPQQLRDTMAGWRNRREGDPISNYDADLHEFQQNLNIKYFGYKDWYEWCLANWGTKWDVGCEDDDFVFLQDGELRLSFDSAWNPPIAAYEAMERLGFGVEAQYYEPGCEFVGEYKDGVDDCYDLRDCPEHLDRQFGVSDSLAEMGQ
jgi:hypothetical protein